MGTIASPTVQLEGRLRLALLVDPKEEIVAVKMIQTPIREMRPEFENAVMQAVVK